MHAGAGLGNDARLAHAARQQDLAQHVVHLVRAGVIEILALEVDFRAAADACGHAIGEIERRRPADIVLEIARPSPLKFRIVLGLRVGLLELEDERHQRLGDEAAAIEAEMPALVGPGAERIGLLDGHALLVDLARVLASSARCRAGRADEGADLVRILVAGRALDAGRDVDAGRPR